MNILRSCLFLCFVLLSSSLSAQWHSLSVEVMTTRLSLEFWCEDQSKADELGTAVLNRFEEIEAKMSRYIPESELSLLNRLAAKQSVRVSPELFSILDKSVLISKMTKGAFDITFASIGHFYDYRKKVKPNSKEIDQNIKAIDYRNIILEKFNRTVRLKDKRVMLDLGGIAKGYAVDEGIKLLKSFGVAYARLSAGGDMYLLGSKREKPWIVAIRDPRDETKNSVVLPLTDVALSTSGDYERFFIDEAGDRVHHIISPKTGKSANGLSSVSILGPDVTTTDALSTAVFVLGLEKGLAIVNKLDGIDAILIDDKQSIYYSDGLARK